MTDPLSAFLAAIPGLAKAGADIANASDETKRNAQLIEFQKVIIQLQSSIAAIQVQNSSLVRDKNELEQELRGLKNWETEKQRYELKALGSGVFAYTLKSEASASEPPHWICSRCYHEGKKSLLQSEGDQWGCTKYLCHSCQSSISVKSSIQPSF
ncbi:MAG: hypothetical protein KGZ83_09375 [Sulfuricella sp.]|nr:hypothetical protein [Sulfuricella sp.]